MVSQIDLGAGVGVPCADVPCCQPDPVTPDTDVPCCQPDPVTPDDVEAAELSGVGSPDTTHPRLPQAQLGDTQVIQNSVALGIGERAVPVAFYCPMCILPVHAVAPAGGACVCGVIYATQPAHGGGVALIFEVPAGSLMASGRFHS